MTDRAVEPVEDRVREPEAEPSSPVALRTVVEWIALVVGAVAVALIIRAFLFQPFWIPSESMEPALIKQDRVMVNKLSYRLGDISRGDIVVFRPPESQAATYDNLIKRVVGLGGEVIEGRDGTIHINGVALAEPYLDPGDLLLDFGPITIPDGSVFLMGDNRDESLDSRVFGSVPETQIIGRASLMFWPLNRIGFL